MSFPPENSGRTISKSSQSNGVQSTENSYNQTIIDRPLSPKRGPKFGNLLEVPSLDREGLASHSTSVSTDEGIAMDDTSQHPPVEYYTTTEAAPTREDLGYCGLPDIFCSRCYCSLDPSNRSNMFAMTRDSVQPTRTFLRMKSEEVPRTEQPTVRHRNATVRFSDRHYQRIKYEERGHSISDAQVLYHPESPEFAGIKTYRRGRRLPKIPMNASSTCSLHCDEKKTIQATKSRCDGTQKPPLLRQDGQCHDSFEEQITRTPIPSRMLIERNRPASVEFSDYDNIEPIYNEKHVVRVQSTQKKQNSDATKLAHIRAKSMDSNRHQTNSTEASPRLRIYNRSATLEHNTAKATTNILSPCNDIELSRSQSLQKTEETDDPTVHKSPAMQPQSLAEKLMSIAPTDQRRVQGIVQDVLFEMGEERILQYKDAFAKFDKDSSGIISSKQLRRLMRTLGHNPGDDELRELVNQVDMDENGKIDFNEFIILVGHFDKANNTSEDLSQIFRVYDEANGGNIDVRELRTICSEYLTGTVATENMNEMIEFIDLDGDGEINREELCRVWSNRW